MYSSKSPLFSRYSGGENIVTSSLIAVFERLDISLVERILGAASNESSLEMVRFANQPAGIGSVPDASISSNFKFLFETKIKRGTVSGLQLRAHLDGFGESSDAQQKLFVITPDLNVPAEILEIADNRIHWFNFAELESAISQILDEDGLMLAEQSIFLLTELIRLFDEKNLLSPDEDVVVVAARDAYDSYLRDGIYACQTDRSFRDGIQRLGFYRFKAVMPEFPKIYEILDDVPFTDVKASELKNSELVHHRRLGEAIERIIENREPWAWTSHKVFLLSEVDSRDTIKLTSPIEHAGKGAWTQSQRYIRQSVLTAGVTNTTDISS
jgi:hypothetical protein